MQDNFEGCLFWSQCVCGTILRGEIVCNLLVENVFYDPLRLDGEKPLCDESGDISPQDSNSVCFNQIIFKFPKLYTIIIHQFLHKTATACASTNFLQIIHNHYPPKSPQDSNKNVLRQIFWLQHF